MPLVLGPLVLLLISLKDTRERFRWFHRRTRIGRKVKKRKREPNAKAARAGRQAHRQIPARAETAPTTETAGWGRGGTGFAFKISGSR